MDFSPVIVKVLELGFAGVAIIVLFMALKSRDQAFRESQEKRLTESQANTEKFLTALNLSNENAKATVNALEGMKKIVEALVVTLSEIKEAGAKRGGRK